MAASLEMKRAALLDRRKAALTADETAFSISFWLGFKIFEFYINHKQSIYSCFCEWFMDTKS